MEPLPRGRHYDPCYYCLGLCHMGLRPASVQGPVPGARERYMEESGLRFMDRVNHVGNINQEGYGNHEGGDGGQEPGQEPPEEPGHAAAATQAQQPGNPPRRRTKRKKFTPVQLQALEDLFQDTQYPDALTRSELARRMDVTETRVQTWFKNRRAKYRRNERASMLQDEPAAGLGQFVVMMFNGT
ncbi:rhox homeobox family member 1-like [Hippopotamus amphibius kiboko]|uniref:rhox homeobox family member 1-like n=1 Tax=Hippopotamus amphibius kiboko TaxID=575201 RepID=UPI002594951F|nr:rhox homeobox family member 1-like [Hippopotamus amphibius kiboko]